MQTRLWLAVALLSSPAVAQDWPHWRGPRYDGSSPVTGLPVEFGPDHNVRWKADLPGPGAATPIVFGERVFLTAIDPEQEGGNALVALCYDRASGALRWRAAAGSGYRPGGKGTSTGIQKRSNYASPSPVTDGERVVFFFGNGDLSCYDLDGERLWARNLQKDFGDFCFQWTFSASPTIFEDTLYLPVLQRDEPANGVGAKGAPSFLLAMDPATGKTRYKHVRPSDARMESLESYATPIPFVGEQGRKEILIMGDVVTGHDPATGKELWRWGTWNPGHREQWWRVVPSPVAGAGLVLACGPKGAPICAVKTGGEGDLGEEGLAWASAGRRNPITTDVPTPAFQDGRFFVMSDLREALSAVDPASGQVEWTTKLPGEARWRASPTAADGKLWCINHAGLVVVVDASDGKLLAENPMAPEDSDQIRASLVPAHGSLFVRTNTTLFCVGETAE